MSISKEEEKKINQEIEAFRAVREIRKSKLYTMGIANGFYLEAEVSEDKEDTGRDIIELTLCRDGFPLKRRWLCYGAPGDMPEEELYDLMAMSVVEGLCCVDDYWSLLWDLVTEDEIVEQCPCCGMPAIGVPVQEETKTGTNSPLWLQ